MKNFDAERETLAGLSRRFTLAGEEFEAMPAMPGWATSDLADVYKNPETPNAWSTMEQAIRATLVPSCRELWDEVLKRDLNPPITFNVMLSVATFLIEEMSGRPPVPQSSSGSTDGRTQTPSTGGFVSVVPPASTSSARGPS